MNLTAKIVSLTVAAAAILGVGAGTAAAAAPAPELHADLRTTSGQTLRAVLAGSGANKEIVITNRMPGRVTSQVFTANLQGSPWVVNQSDQTMTLDLWKEPGVPIADTTLAIGARFVLHLPSGTATAATSGPAAAHPSILAHCTSDASQSYRAS